MHMHHSITPIVFVSILRQPTVQHKRIITVTQRREWRGPDPLAPEERRPLTGAFGLESQEENNKVKVFPTIIVIRLFSLSAKSTRI